MIRTVEAGDLSSSCGKDGAYDRWIESVLDLSTAQLFQLYVFLEIMILKRYPTPLYNAELIGSCDGGMGVYVLLQAAPISSRFYTKERVRFRKRSINRMSERVFVSVVELYS